MGLLDRLFGRRRSRDPAGAPTAASRSGARPVRRPGHRALPLPAAPPHRRAGAAEAFAQLTPDQRQQVLTQLRPPSRRVSGRTDDPGRPRRPAELRSRARSSGRSVATGRAPAAADPGTARWLRAGRYGGGYGGPAWAA